MILRIVAVRKGIVQLSDSPEQIVCVYVCVCEREREGEDDQKRTVSPTQSFGATIRQMAFSTVKF